jgi:hypothetical protein
VCDEHSSDVGLTGDFITGILSDGGPAVTMIADRLSPACSLENSESVMAESLGVRADLTARLTSRAAPIRRTIAAAIVKRLIVLTTGADCIDVPSR